MAINAQFSDMPAWMSRSSDWTQRQPNQFTEGLRLAVHAKNQQQNQALEARALALRAEQTDILNQQRLEALNQAALKTKDIPLLAEFAKNPDGDYPAFNDPDSYSVANQIRLGHSRQALQKKEAAEHAELNKRILKLTATDSAAVRRMQRQGADELDILEFVGTAEKRATRNFAPPEMQKILDLAERAEADGDMEVAALYRQRAETIARGGKEVTGRMSGIDAAEYRRLNTRLNIINKQAEDFSGTGDAAKQLRKEREGIESELGAIKQKYSEAQPATEAAPKATDFTKGQRVVQEGVTYEFDGDNWNAVK